MDACKRETWIDSRQLNLDACKTLLLYLFQPKLYNIFWNIENLPFSNTKVCMTDYDDGGTRFENRAFWNVFFPKTLDLMLNALIYPSLRNNNGWYFSQSYLSIFIQFRQWKTLNGLGSICPLNFIYFIFHIWKWTGAATKKSYYSIR